MELSNYLIELYELFQKAIRKSIKETINIENYNPSITLVTKIMLGVFANIPAFDSKFVKAFNELYSKIYGIH